MKIRSMAIALMAEYGDCWPGAISLMGRSCITRCPAAASQAVVGSRSLMWQKPQPVARGHENSGVSMPDRRPRDCSVIAWGHRAEMSQNAVEALGKHGVRRQQTQNEIRL